MLPIPATFKEAKFSYNKSMKEKINVVIVTGLSGAGKTKTIGILEDIGYFCVDNLPPTLISDFVELCKKTDGKINKIGIVVDIRSGEFLSLLPEIISKLRKDKRFSVKVVFLEASEEILIRRFSETRRKHPIQGMGTIQEKIEEERKELYSIRANADYIIDTSNYTLKDLKEKIVSVISHVTPELMSISIITFGYKYGIPLQSDIVIDVRFIPNPFYVDKLSKKDGRDKAIKDFVLSFSETKEFLKKMEDLLVFLIPNYIKEGKSYLTIALGCTGGKHRSVAIGELLGDFLKSKYYPVTVTHRDVEK